MQLSSNNTNYARLLEHKVCKAAFHSTGKSTADGLFCQHTCVKGRSPCFDLHCRSMARAVPHKELAVRLVHDDRSIVCYAGFTGEVQELDTEQFSELAFTPAGWGVLKPLASSNSPEGLLKDLLNKKVFQAVSGKYYVHEGGSTSWLSKLSVS
eukprot:5756309-Lingulodinium_polyedra.AAC.1